MNDFELTLAAALRAEAEEIVMSIDQQRASDELESRMDRAEHSRHAVYWVAAAVVGVLVIGAAALVAVKESGESTRVMPGTVPPKQGITYTSTTFEAPFTVSLPVWMSAAVISHPETYPDAVYWNTLACVSPGQVDCSPGDVGMRFAVLAAIYKPGVAEPLPAPGYDDYLTFLEGLQSSSGLVMTDRSETTIDGRRATVMTLTPTREVDDARFLCDAAAELPDDCWFPTMGRLLRVAVVDTGGKPFVVWMAGHADAMDRWPALTQDFSGMLGSVRLGTAPAPSAS